MIAKHWKIRKVNSWNSLSLKQTRPKNQLKGHITLTKAIRSCLVEGNQTHTTFLNIHIIKPLIKNRRKLGHALKPNQKVLPKKKKKTSRVSEKKQNYES